MRYFSRHKTNRETKKISGTTHSKPLTIVGNRLRALRSFHPDVDKVKTANQKLGRILTKNHFKLLAGLFSILLIVSVLGVIRHVLASSSWTQTDWSGGVGTSTTNQYSSATNANTTGTAGQVTLTSPNTGSGSDGSVTLSSSTNINSDNRISGRSCADGGDAVNYSVTSSVASGQNSITLSSTPSSGCLAVNDEILIINLQRTSGGTTGVGNYETATVSSITSGTLTLASNLANTYDGTTQKIMVQRVPNYTNVTVQEGVTLSANAWDGTKGGVVFFRASGTVTVAGSISTTSMGFRGGDYVGDCSYNYSYQGESYAGTGSRTNAANYGGGGGAHIENCPNSNYWAGAGAGGGYASSGSDTTGGSEISTGGSSYGTASLSKLYLGSGGGGGGWNPGTSSAGGGIIMIAASTVSVTGTISSNSTETSSCDGGSGSGGSILIQGGTLTLGSSLVTASAGAAGGTCGYPGNRGAAGQGSSGIIAVYSPNSVSGTTSPTYGNANSNYFSSATLTSSIYDGSAPNDWGTLTYNATVPAGTSLSVKVRTGNQADLSDASSFGSCSAVSSGNDVTSACASDQTRYAQYQVSFTATDSTATPTLQDITLGYSASDTVAPTTNASAVLMYKSNGGDSVSSNGWINANPYFSWTAGADNVGGTGIQGYCLYLGQDMTADVTTTKGLLGTSPLNTSGVCQFAVTGTSIDLSTSGYIGTPMSSSNSSYYLLVKAIDNAGNVYGGSAASFQFRYDNTVPTNLAFVTAPSQFVSSKNVTLTWDTGGDSAASDTNSGLAGLQYRVGSSGTWYGDSHTGNQNISDLLANDGSYTMQSTPDYANLQEGNNVIYFRAWDNAGNYSTTYTTTVIKINTTSPSSPQNITATPSTNTTNSFAFSWAAPHTFSGSASNITYCYTINSTPTSNNCTFTEAGVTSLSAGAYATQPGDNTFYVVAKDEAGNVNYATAGSTIFTANTSAPGIPLNLDVADISVKSTANWKLAISWESPTNVGAGVSSYRIYRSTDNSSFSQIASTSGTSYVDGGLSQVRYYYKVKACDSANNCGSLTGSVNDLPTGQFTSAATLVSNPSVSKLSTKKATVSWATNRDSDSKIALGTKSGNYADDEIANSNQTSSHSINLNNLTPGTTYYYVAKWTDEDGNTGTSAESTFTTLPAPSVSDVKVVSIDVSSATVKFTSKAAVKVSLQYGKTKSFGGITSINTSSSESTYSVDLTGLDDGAEYFYKLNAFDEDGNEYENLQTNSFSTPARPRISNLRFQPVADQPTSTQQITWDTNVPTTSELAYGPQGQAKQNALSTALSNSHSLVIKDLSDDTVYSLVARSRDSAGNLAVSDEQIFKTALDTRPPKISDIKVVSSIKGTGGSNGGQLVISWKTDEPSTSQVAYGEGSATGSYNKSTAEDASLVTDHVVIISNLPTSTIFHLQVVSRDGSKNQSVSSNYTSIVGNASDSVLGIIFNALRKVFGI